jgi:hypothetical protein
MVIEVYLIHFIGLKNLILLFLDQDQTSQVTFPFLPSFLQSDLLNRYYITDITYKALWFIKRTANSQSSQSHAEY